MRSGNIIGAEMWSDGFFSAPMMLVMEQVTRCAHCTRIFWVREAGTLERSPGSTWGEADLPQPLTSEEDVPMLQKPGIPDLRKALQELREDVSPLKELHLRMQLWWDENHAWRGHGQAAGTTRKPAGKPDKQLPIDEPPGPDPENLERLLSILGEEEDDRITKAAILLALERFDAVQPMLRDVVDEDLLFMKRAMLEAADRRDAKPFRIW
jgi:hypothetical protein